MSLLHDAYVALLAGLTTKTGEEIHWKGKYGESLTIEPIDIETEKYIVREYRKNGGKRWEDEYQYNKLHGKTTRWYENGNKQFEIRCKNNIRHGKSTWWNPNGNKKCESEYQNGELHGKVIVWDSNGNKIWNVSRFLLMNLKNDAKKPLSGLKSQDLSLADRWIWT